MTQYSGVYTLQNQGQALTSGQWATEPYFKNTTLLLHADGVAGGAQNNTFLDSSTNAFAITRNGNTTQGTFSPYGPDWSNYFGGAGNYLSNTTAALITASVSTFTAEAWICLTADPTVDANNIGSVVSLDGQPAGTVNYLAFGPISTRKLRLRWYDGASKYAEGSTTLAIGTWYHVAVVVTSNAITMYVNGVAETLSGTTTLTTRSGTTGNFAIGSNYYGATTGYISNLRVTTTAVYSSGFTPSTTPLTAVSGTSLLTCQSNRFIDNSSNVYALTVGGTPSVQRFSPFPPQYQYTSAVIGGSGYFDDNGDYLTSTGVVLGTGNVTFEFWIYPFDSSTTYNCVYDTRASGDTNSGFGIFQYGLTIEVYTAALVVASAAGSVKVNAWNHVALVRNSGTCQLYINGVASGSSAANSTNLSSTERRIATGSTSAYYYYGYITDLRENSTAVYTTTFTPPTAPLPAISGTQMLLNMTNAGILDNAMMNNLETVGNAQVSTSVVKYGSGSMYFDGTGDYLKSSGVNLSMGTGDFTIEFWFYALAYSSSSDTSAMFDSRSGNDTSGFLIGPLASDTNKLHVAQNTSAIITASTTYPLNTWVHCAVVRSSGTITLYQDGVNVGSVANSTNNTATTNYIASGYWTPAGAGYMFNGYMDDFRITKGVARYTGNFIPPKVAFANQ